jgi:hypothetical protein
VVEAFLRGGRCSPIWARADIEALKGFAGATPIRFEAQTNNSLAGIRGVALNKPIRAVLVFDAPPGALPGDSWEVNLMLMNSGGKVVGGNAYRCRMTLPPDFHKDVQIDVDVSGIAQTREIAVRLTSKGKAATGADGQVFGCAFTELGMVQPPLTLLWDQPRNAFLGTITLDQGEATVGRMTIVGRVDKLEGRKTIDLRIGGELRRC